MIIHIYNKLTFKNTITPLSLYMSSSVLCRTAGSIFLSLSPLVTIIHHSRQIFKTTSCVRTDKLDKF